MDHIKIASEYITLGQFLKFVGLISNGGDAKFAVKTLKITVNGALEDRRGRKLYPGDLVVIEKNTYKVEKGIENN